VGRRKQIATMLPDQAGEGKQGGPSLPPPGPKSGLAATDWSEFRRQMPVTERWAYLDHAAVGPLPTPSAAAVVEWAQQASQSGGMSWPDWDRGSSELRPAFASLIGASTEEIALIRNTTEGISLVAEGFRWQPGDNVVTLADEFPTNQYPWMNLAEREVETRRVPTTEGKADPDRLAAACDRRTRIVAISWVSYSSGWRNDLALMAEIAHRCGALLMVDAVQGLGVIPLDVRSIPVDFLAADGHKWMLGPEGAGVLYIRREHLDRLRALGVGWNSVVHAHEFDRIELTLKPTAARYEGGSRNMVGSLGLLASLRLLGRFGPEAIFHRISQITDAACQRLAQIGVEIHSDRRPEHKSGIVVFKVPGRDPQGVRQKCLAQGVVLSRRGVGLRISPHAYNDESDIDRLISAIQSAAA
jgi:cysteine desulfurase/selenocysteine lyase